MQSKFNQIPAVQKIPLKMSLSCDCMRWSSAPLYHIPIPFLALINSASVKRWEIKSTDMGDQVHWYVCDFFICFSHFPSAGNDAAKEVYTPHKPLLNAMPDIRPSEVPEFIEVVANPSSEIVEACKPPWEEKQGKTSVLESYLAKSVS